MSKLTPAQLKRFRFFRDKGFTIKEARRVACLSYQQTADELSQRSKRKRHAGTFTRAKALPHRGLLLEDDEL